MKLQGKNAIVTGGTQGLGKAIVTAYLKEGASVCFCARTQSDIDAALLEYRPLLASGQQVMGQSVDIADEAQVNAFYQKAKQTMGSVDILVNNAGVYGPIGLSEEIDVDAWWQAIAVNLKGTLLVCRAVIPEMKARKSGKIIVVSGGGATNPMPRFSAYAASKAGLVRLTETLAGELAPFGIEVNSIAPGALKTRMMEQVLQAGPAAAGADFYAKNVKWMETGATSPDLGASLCVHLATDASKGIFGKLISAQWDPWQSLAEHREELAKTDIYTVRRLTPRDRGATWGMEDVK